jgi:hypothetical protein
MRSGIGGDLYFSQPLLPLHSMEVLLALGLLVMLLRVMVKRCGGFGICTHGTGDPEATEVVNEGRRKM